MKGLRSFFIRNMGGGVIKIDGLAAMQREADRQRRAREAAGLPEGYWFPLSRRTRSGAQYYVAVEGR